MIVLFIVGMPCSGKTEVGKALFSRFGQFARMIGLGNRSVQFLEMSDIIRQALYNLGHTSPDLSIAPMKSTAIYKALWNEIVLFPITILSGVREQFLMDSINLTPSMLRIASSRVRLPPLSISIALDVSEEVRISRFDKRQENRDLVLSFEKAEQRAIDMQVPELMNKCSIKVSYDQKSIDRVVDDIVVKLAYLFAQELSSPETRDSQSRFAKRIEDSCFDFDDGFDEDTEETE